MTYRSDCPKIAATKRQKAAVARRLEQVPESIREEVAACLEAMWAPAAQEAREYCQDLERRKTVGARVPREMADRIKAAADRQDLSVYAWVVSAFTAKLADDERPPWE